MAVPSIRDRTDAGVTSPAGDGGFRMRNLGRHSLVYGVGMVLGKAVSFLMLPIYTRFLTPADYGVLQLVMMVLEVLTIFAGSRIAFGIFHYYHKASGQEAQRTVISTATLLLVTTYGIAAIAAVLLAPHIATLVFGEGGQFARFIRLAAVSMAFEGLIVVPMALYQLRHRSTQFVAVSIGRVLVQVALNLVFLMGLDMGVEGVLLSSLLASGVFGVVLVGQLLQDVGLRFALPDARQFLRFGTPLVVMQIATFVFTFGDRYFLNRAADEATVGLYGLAYQFGFLVATIGFMPFQRVWDPQRFAVAKRPDRDPIYARVFIYLNLGLITAALGTSLFAGDVLRIIADPAFHSAASYVPIIVAAYVLHCWASFLNVGIYVSEKTEYFAIANWAAAAIAVAGYLVLIPHWHAWGAATVAFVSLAVRFWLSYYFSQRLWPVEYEWWPVLRLTLVAIFAGAVGIPLPQLPLGLSLGVHTAVFATYTMLVWTLVLSTQDKAGIARLAAQLLKLQKRYHMG